MTAPDPYSIGPRAPEERADYSRERNRDLVWRAMLEGIRDGERSRLDAGTFRPTAETGMGRR